MPPSQIEARFGNILFFSNFDSGNLARVERIKREESEENGEQTSSTLSAPPLQPDYEFQCWTSPDCSGLSSENGNRTWFYFGVKGCPVGRLLKITMMNLNKQGKLYSQGMTPLVKVVSATGKNRWERIRDRPTYENIEGQFQLTFTYRIPDHRYTAVYFAFCYPFSYEECQNMLQALDEQFIECQNYTPSTPAESIYYHREMACSSLDGLRIDLVTISSCHGMIVDREPRLQNLFPELDKPRPNKFKGKKVYFLSSRVHPGETPSSFVFNGFLKFLLRPNDPRAAALRKKYVFKLVPMLNPDGVRRGHYRTDSRGVNLNRMYLDPSFALHPSIYAAKSIIMHHHVQARILSQECTCPKKEVELKKKEHTPEGKTKTNAEENNKTKEKIQNQTKRPSSSETSPPKNPKVIQKQKSCPSLPIDGVPSANLRGEPDGSPPLDNSPGSGRSEDANQGGEVTSTVRQPPDGMELRDNHKIPNCFHDKNNNDCYHDNSDKENRDASEEGGKKDSPVSNKSVFCDISQLCAVLDKVELEDSGDNSSVEDVNVTKNSPSAERSPVENKKTPVKAEKSPAKCQCSPPDETDDSGIAYYVDLHGHASKRGCFMYGNYLDTEPAYVKSIMYPKIISINSAHFDFSACTFTLRNMYSKDKRDGMSKEGSGRVAIYKATGISNSYTLECNYNCGRTANCVPPATCDRGCASPPPPPGFPPKFTMEIFEDVGRNMAIASLDMKGMNPWSRLPMSEHGTVDGVRNWVVRYVRSMKNAPSLPRKLSRVASKTSSLVAGATSRQHLTSSVINSKSSSSTNSSDSSSQTRLSDRTRTSLMPVKEQGNKSVPPKAPRRALTMSVITSPLNNKTFTSPVALRSITRLTRTAVNQAEEQTTTTNVPPIASQNTLQKDKARAPLPFNKPTVPTLKLVRKPTVNFQAQTVIPVPDNALARGPNQVHLTSVDTHNPATGAQNSNISRLITKRDQGRKSSGTSTDSGDDKKRGRRKSKRGRGSGRGSQLGKIQLDSNTLEGCTVPLVERVSPRLLDGASEKADATGHDKTKSNAYSPLNRKSSLTKSRSKFKSKMMPCEVVDITALPTHQSPPSTTMDSVAYWIDLHS